ncbi:hypothetical protein D3C75_1273950 [compost metagenome]
MGGHVIGAGLVELAPKGFGQPGPHTVDDHYFTHGTALLWLAVEFAEHKSA